MELNNDNVQQLIAENNRLKRIVSRLSERELGTAMGSDSGESRFLPTVIGEILMGNVPFGEKIKEVLQYLDRYFDCDRVVLFHYNKVNRSHIFLESASEITSAVKLSLKGAWEQLEAFLQRVDNGVWQSDAAKPDELETFSPFFGQLGNQKSVLLFPLHAGTEATGFLAFEESLFARQWFPIEKELLRLVAIQLASAFVHNRDRVELEKKEAINGYLLKIAETFSHNDRFEIQARQSIEITGRFFGFSRVLLCENVGNDLCRVVDECVASSVIAIKDELQCVSYAKHLPGFYPLVADKKVLNCCDPLLREATAYLTRNVEMARLIIGIHSTNGLHGFISFEDSRPDRRWSDDEINAFVVVADLFASAFERQHAMDNMVASHQESIVLTKQLREKENFLENILSSVPLGIIIVRNREIVFANKYVVERTKVPESELIGCNLSQFYFDLKSESDLSENFYRQIHRDGIGLMEVVMKNLEGKPIVTNVIGKVCPINGFKESYLLIAQDMTLLKQAQLDLLESEERYRKILETTIEGVLILESAEKVVFINNAAREMFGWDDDEDCLPMRLFRDERDVGQFIRSFAQINSGGDFSGDFQISTGNGSPMPVEVYGSKIVIKGKELYYFSFRNIADRKRHEAVLMQSEEKFRTLSENTADHIVRLGQDGKLLFANYSFRNFYQLANDGCLGQNIYNLLQIPKELGRSLIQGCNRCLAEKASSQVDVTFIHNGQSMTIEWRILPELGNSGAVVSYLCSGRDMTQRKAFEQELREAKEKAESADRLKSAFLANLSHEVRTPLNAIVGFSSLLKEGDVTPREQDEFVNIIVRSADHLMALISDIIDIAKIESGVLNIEKNIFPVNEMLRDINMVFQKRIKLDRRNVIEQLVLDLPPMDVEPLIESDCNRITQILNNLLDNAMKFTHKGVITFGYRIDGGMFRFFVKDSGIGIDYDKLGIIFLPFRQGDETVSKRYGGTGLGLSISKKLCEALGGSIHVDSMPGEGSTFYFEIPDSDLRMPLSKGIRQNSNSLAKSNEQRCCNWGDKIVLLVDDSSTAHMQVRKVLEKTGATLISARSAASAREVMKKQLSVAVVLVDTEMAELDLGSFVTQLKQLHRDVRVVGMVAAVMRCGDDAAMALFDGLVDKPLETEQLLLKLGMAMGAGHRQVAD